MSEMILNAIEKSKNRTIKEKLKRTILASQHLVAMFGATVLVPILTGLDPSVALFSAGLGTLIFHLCTKGKVPVFLGSSFAFIPVIIEVGNANGGDLTYAQGGIFVAGIIYVIASFVIKKIGVEKVKAVLPAQVVGPMIMVIGLNLIPTAWGMASSNWTLALITLGVTLIVKFAGKGFIKQIAILMGVFVGYFLALFMGEVATAEIANAALFSVPNFTLPSFNSAAIIMIAPVVLAVFMEHLGDITTNGQVVGENFLEEPGLNRTLLGDGLATIAASLVGGPANTTYGENTGVLAVTKNYDPSILRITAVFAILLAFVSKFGAVIRTVPQSVMGGISLMLFTMIAIIGPKTIKAEKVKFTWRNIVVMAVVLFFGLGQHLGIEALNQILVIPLGSAKIAELSGLSLAALAGVLTNLILNIIFKEKEK